MPGTANPRKDAMRHEQWQVLFPDRDEQRTAIAEFLGDLAGSFTRPKFPILQFYGVSGQGKTSLYSQTAREAPDRFPAIHFARLDLADLSSTRIDSPMEVLWSIANALAVAGILCPLSLCLYAHYWRKQNPGEEFRLGESALQDYIKHCIASCEVLEPFTGLLHTLGDFGQSAFKVVGLLDRLWSAARDRASKLKIADLRREDPGVWTLDRIEGSLPEFLAFDVLSHLKDHGDRKLCLMLDTFERLEPGAKGDGCERLFQDLCSRLVSPHGETGEPSPELRGRTGVLLFGREELRWERYDPPDSSDPWRGHIRSHLLGGFTRQDAITFLRGDFTDFWRKRQSPEVASQLQAHEEAVLAAADEREGVEPATYPPYYLRLAGEIIYEAGSDFRPEMLGRSPVQMQERFVKYLRERSPEKFRAVQTLALALYFDGGLFDHLVRANHIQGLAVGCLVPELLRDRSYVRQFETGGQTSYRFHWHMRQSLLDDIDQTPARNDAARPAIAAILDYYATRAAFAAVADFDPAVHLPAYEHGVDVLLTHAAAGRGGQRRIPPESLAEWLNRFESPFDRHTATPVRVRVLERALAMREEALGPSHPHTAADLNSLAGLYHAQGRYQEAEPLYRRALAISEEALGPGHLHTATSLNNLAEIYRAQGRYPEAEPMYRRALAIREEALGRSHPDTATSLNNLAGLYWARGRYEDAAPLYRRALKIFEEARGRSHRDTAASLGSLAELYRAQGRYQEAEPMYVRALAICQQALGLSHPDTATSLNNLAGLYCAQERYEDAEPLYRRAVEIREEALGPSHAHTAASLNNLAELYRAQGRREEAEQVFRRLLALRERLKSDS